MKTYLFELILWVSIVMGPWKADGQKQTGLTFDSYKGDTLRYLTEKIIDHKARYLGQPLDTMLNDLEIPIGSYFYEISANNRSIVPGLCMYFSDAAAHFMSKFPKSGSISITISFAQPPLKDSGIRIYKQNQGVWLEDEERFYGPLVIKDIRPAGPIKYKD